MIVPSKKDHERLATAKKIAANSSAKYRMGAVIYAGAKFISAGVNVVRSHPAHKHYPEWVVSIHAEHRAILLARTSVVGATLYVARDGGPDSCPCHSCRVIMYEAGIRYVVYYRRAEIVKEKL